MDIQKTQRERQLFAQRNVILGLLLAGSIATNLLLAVVAINGGRTILVPTLPADASLDVNGRVDADYLEDMTRDVTWLFLNKTPETAAYFVRRAQRIMDPGHFEAAKLALEKDSARAEQTHTSQAFFPEDFYVDPGKLYSEVRGQLTIVQGAEVVDVQSKTYALTWTKTGTLLRLAAIAEIDPKDARGDKLSPMRRETM